MARDNSIAHRSQADSSASFGIPSPLRLERWVASSTPTRDLYFWPSDYHLFTPFDNWHSYDPISCRAQNSSWQWRKIVQEENQGFGTYRKAIAFKVKPRFYIICPSPSQGDCLQSQAPILHNLSSPSSEDVYKI